MFFIFFRRHLQKLYHITITTVLSSCCKIQDLRWYVQSSVSHDMGCN